MGTLDDIPSKSKVKLARNQDISKENNVKTDNSFELFNSKIKIVNPATKSPDRDKSFFTSQ